MTRAEELHRLAGWYREYAERAGNPTIWAARLRTAEDMEAEAERLAAAAARIMRQVHHRNDRIGAALLSFPT